MARRPVRQAPPADAFLALISVAVLLTALAPDLETVAVARPLTGFSIRGAGPVLLGEVTRAAGSVEHEAV
ncbi:hypothetical protein [Streptomyces zaehneri]|uniref:hypothetical protein n=1 Tax=Streptomyces zaehneri TaxID=3051180 RepID=UPI0028D51204|nr:hypothetical protein [Streptomyces sp. DSM 40713]